MIKDRDLKAQQIVETILRDVKDAELFDAYKLGCYKRLLAARFKAPNVRSFLSDESSMRLIYETLDAWDMNKRRAKMKPFESFRDSILCCMSDLVQLEKVGQSPREVPRFLRSVYDHLHVMDSKAKLVSNAKFLHFLFPNLLMPADREHTLNYLYGVQTYAPPSRYLEIIDFQWYVQSLSQDLHRSLDHRWNTTIPKMVDNAIIILRRKQKRHTGRADFS